MWWKKKESIPKIKIINFVIRNNRIYEILFNGQELFLNKKKIWIRAEEKIPSDVTCILRFLGTGPQKFRQQAKKKKIHSSSLKKVKV